MIEELEHTADLYLRVISNNFENALKELIQYLGKYMNAKEKKEFLEFYVEGDEKEILIKTIEDILYFADAFKLVPVDAEIRKKNNGYLIKIYFDKVEHFNEIKAITYHKLKLEQKEDKYIIEVLFDI